MQLAEREFELKKHQMESELLNVEQKIKVVNRELVTMATDSKERERFSILKGDLEIQKKKHKKM